MKHNKEKSMTGKQIVMLITMIIVSAITGAGYFMLMMMSTMNVAFSLLNSHLMSTVVAMLFYHYYLTLK